MVAELHAGFILLASLAFFLIIVAIFSLGMVMRPDRWSDRARFAGEARSNGSNKLSVMHDAS